MHRKARGNLVKQLVSVNMLMLLHFMHHIALCTPCIAHFDLASCLCMYARSQRAGTQGASGASSS
jgi:hypothetical protein